MSAEIGVADVEDAYGYRPPTTTFTVAGHGVVSAEVVAIAQCEATLTGLDDVAAARVAAYLAARFPSPSPQRDLGDPK